jgi:hypothetical protein
VKQLVGLISDLKIMKAIEFRDQEMMANGLQRRSLIDLDITQRYYAFEQDNEIISFLAYERYLLPRNIRIIGAWTHSTYRQQGLYTKLFSRLVHEHKNDYDRVSSGYHENNFPSAQMQKERGSKIVGFRNQFYATEFNLRNSSTNAEMS